jgi:hypothetical protein
LYLLEFVRFDKTCTILIISYVIRVLYKLTIIYTVYSKVINALFQTPLRAKFICLFSFKKMGQETSTARTLPIYGDSHYSFSQTTSHSTNNLPSQYYSHGRAAVQKRIESTLPTLPSLLAHHHPLSATAPNSTTAVSPVRLTPEEWIKILGFDGQVGDPDGWDRANFAQSWQTPISLYQMCQNLARSTLVGKTDSGVKLRMVEGKDRSSPIYLLEISKSK